MLSPEELKEIAEYFEARLNIVTMGHEMSYHNVIHSKSAVMSQKNIIDRFEKKWQQSPLISAEQIKN